MHIYGTLPHPRMQSKKCYGQVVVELLHIHTTDKPRSSSFGAPTPFLPYKCFLFTLYLNTSHLSIYDVILVMFRDPFSVALVREISYIHQ